MPLDIIGAGFGRTGTRSLKDALELLGTGRCYHMTELMADRSRLPLWEAVAAGDPPDWEAVFDGFRSTVDFPGCLYWRELADRYPDAKVILSVREPEAWYDSVAATIYPSSTIDRPDRTEETIRLHGWIRDVVWGRQFGGRFEDRAHALRVWHDHVEEVTSTLPAHRLLVYELGSGWEPLCAFLGRPIPDAGYPLVNTKAEFLGRPANQ